MEFGPLSPRAALGAILAHGVKQGDVALKKGHVLEEEDVAALEAARVDVVMAARLDAGDVSEDEAARRLAAALEAEAITADQAFAGRANLRARAAGLLLVDKAGIDRLNAVHEAITVATLEDYGAVASGTMAATVKIIPFAAPKAALDDALAIARAAPLLRLAPYRRRRALLVQSENEGVAEKVLAKTRRITEDRLAAIDADLIGERRCAHQSDAIAAALDEARASLEFDLVLIAGAQAIGDRRDAIPAAIARLGGEILHFGMPVDPGNLLLFATWGAADVIGLPGCARSPKLNGLDWVLRRLAAGAPVDRGVIQGMGVGGLLSEIPSRPHPRARRAAEAAPASRIGAILLAAGRSTRMGDANKLLLPVDGEAMARRAARAANEAGLAPIVAVTGHEAKEVEAALQGLDLAFAHNADFASGLASSLRAGVEALGRLADLDGVVVLLGDMPGVNAAHVRALVDRFAPEEGRTIVVASHRGKRGNPVLFARKHFEAMAMIEGDVGARALIGARPEETVAVDFDDDAPLADLDTPEAYRAFRAEPSS